MAQHRENSNRSFCVNPHQASVLLPEESPQLPIALGRTPVSYHGKGRVDENLIGWMLRGNPEVYIGLIVLSNSALPKGIV